MRCTTAVNTSNTIRTQTGAAEPHHTHSPTPRYISKYSVVSVPPPREKDCGVVVVSVWCAWSLDEGWYLWAIMIIFMSVIIIQIV